MKIQKNTKFILGLIVGIIISGSIGVVVATNIASSSVDYSTTENNNVENVEDALDDLYNQIIGHPLVCYNGTCGKLSYRYWNNNFAGSSGSNQFDLTHMPATTYATRALLEQNYGTSNFEEIPIYIKSILIDGNVVGHESCIWHNNREFCLKKDYWAGTIGTNDSTVGVNTKIKLRREIQNELNIEIAASSCSSEASGAYCVIGDSYCGAHSPGYVYFRKNSVNSGCRVNADGSASCY